jgi:hypothetical protein
MPAPQPGPRPVPVDPVVSPADYPGPRAPCSGRLQDGRFTPLDPDELSRLGGSRYTDRLLVVAVGSNASPAVVHRKLHQRDCSDHVVFVAATLTGCSVGHSAHVSVPGFVPAAPFADPGASTQAMVLLLDPQQVECLDTTEPNYVRRRVSGSAMTLRLGGGERRGSFDLYDTRWGVLAPPGGRPLALTTQADLHEHLAAHWQPYAALFSHAGAHDPEGAPSALAGRADLRTRMRKALHDTGWACPNGLAGEPAQPGGAAVTKR